MSEGSVLDHELSEPTGTELEIETASDFWPDFYEPEEESDDDFCPCGHKRKNHWHGDGECQRAHCQCQEFGEVPEDEVYTQVWYTEGPCGHNYYE